MSGVELQAVTKRFRDATGNMVAGVENLTLAIGEGELLALVGPSGSGKTTTLRLLAGLEEPTTGTIRIGDQIVNGVDPRERDVAMVFQNQSLYPHMSVYENLAFPLELRKAASGEIETRVRDAAAKLGLADCLDRRPEELSGGQRQRVALGRALVRRPSLFLLDEPLSNLDPPLRVQLRAEIARLHSSLRATMIYVTHDQAEAMALGDRIAVLRQGALQQVATSRELYQHPANLFVASFIGTPPMNLISGAITRDRSGIVFRPDGETSGRMNEGLLPLPPGTGAAAVSLIDKRAVLGLRPEHIRWPEEGRSGPGATTLEALVEVVERVGPETYVHLKSGCGRLIARGPADLNVKVNEKINAQLGLAHAVLFDAQTGRRVA